MEYADLNISVSRAERIALEMFNVKGEAKPLPGDLDFNFRIRTGNCEDYLLKISRPGANNAYLDFQQALLQHIGQEGKDILAPQVFTAGNGKTIAEFTDDFGQQRKVRLLSWVSGRLWSSVNPKVDSLRYSLGEQCGKITAALQNFDHPEAYRKFEWDIATSLWTRQHLHLFNKSKQKILSYFQYQFEGVQKTYNELRKSVVHNDANDNNIIVSEDLINPHVRAVIDYGDTIYTQTINDLAIACAYAIMGQNDPLDAALPLVQGYHSKFPLEAAELEHLFLAIAMRLVITVTQSALRKEQEPENLYLQISEKDAWDLLKKWRHVPADFAHYSFRTACGWDAHPKFSQFKTWATSEKRELTGLFPTIGPREIYPLDLSVSSKWLGHEAEFNDLELFQFRLRRLQAEYPHKLIAGGYWEPRAIYDFPGYKKEGNSGRESRTVHLGLDFWLPAQTPVHALWDGEVAIAVNDAGEKKYGGLVVLKHHTEGFDFYTLYGHLTPSDGTDKRVGQLFRKGDCIGRLGNLEENGNWAAHLHFQVMMSLLGQKRDFPGVAYFRQQEIWRSLCPDPNILFQIEALDGSHKISNDALLAFRKEHLGKSLSLQYDTPIKMVRGSGAYLIDSKGRKYLDTVNNVAHVGHENFAVVKAGQDQMALLNTNTRYLHENINALTRELLETLPPELSVLHFVNSGSEANELAIRMVKAATGQRDIIASEMGYHGNSNMCIDISSYKFDGKGGKGAPEHTHIIPLPDAFRGKYRGKDAGSQYASEVQKQIEIIHAKGRGIGAFIIEPIISCGGQIELPEGFLNQAYEFVRAAGGLCISDEVQVGCGRMGKTFWGFQLHGVVPDIVTIGKPLGNGHPIAAVACTREVADKFANGMEYFNTFGGNPVSCAIGAAVLQTIKRENLQKNALETGTFLKLELNKLARKFPIIGDVRGQGLFLGFELVDSNMNPLGGQAGYLANRMKDHGILMSTDGPDHNVLKIKPPLVFNKEHAKELVFYLTKVLGEDFMKEK